MYNLGIKIKKNKNVGLYLPTLFFASMLVETQVVFLALCLYQCLFMKMRKQSHDYYTILYSHNFGETSTWILNLKRKDFHILYLIRKRMHGRHLFLFIYIFLLSNLQITTKVLYDILGRFHYNRTAVRWRQIILILIFIEAG